MDAEHILRSLQPPHAQDLHAAHHPGWCLWRIVRISAPRRLGRDRQAEHLLHRRIHQDVQSICVAKVPEKIQAAYPSEITSAEIGERTLDFSNTMNSCHARYAHLMFAILKRCPEESPPEGADSDGDDSDSDSDNGSRVDCIIRIKHGALDLGEIKWMDDGDTLKYQCSSFSCWTRRHFRIMSERVEAYYAAAIEEEEEEDKANDDKPIASASAALASSTFTS